jgi:hypothetical protein
MADTITSRIEAQGLEDAEHEFERHQTEVIADATFMGRVQNMVRHNPTYAVLAGLGLGLGLGLLVRGLSCSRD